MGARVMSDDAPYRVVATDDRYAYVTYVTGEAMLHAAIVAVCDKVAASYKDPDLTWEVTGTFPEMNGDKVHLVQYRVGTWRCTESVTIQRLTVATRATDITVQYVSKEDR